MPLKGLFFFIVSLSLSASADFHPTLNIDNLVKVSWKNGEVKLAIRNDWIEDFLKTALNDELHRSSDIKSGNGEVHVVNQSPGDSIVTLGFSVNVVPSGVWFDPHVLCHGRLRLSFPQMPLAIARAQVLDREPIESCEVNGAIGHGLDLGKLVKNRLNERIARLGDRDFLIDIGHALYGSEDLRKRMTRMYLLQELFPLATMGMDDCEGDSDLGLAMGTSICLKLQWPAPSFDGAVAKILSQVPSPQPTEVDIPAERIQQWRSQSPTCSHLGIPYPSKSDCDTGDMTLFAGLLCLSGEQVGCQMVHDAQDQSGRWWRSPLRVGHAGENFSGDMFLGVVAYLNRMRDQAALRNWVRSLLEQTRLFPPEGSPQMRMFQSCPNGAEGVCSLMGNEWYWLQGMRGWDQGLGAMPEYGYDSSWLVVESLSNERGFRLHLVAVNVLLQQMFGDPADLHVMQAAQILAVREPQNPFFVYLALGRDQRVLDLIEAQCPAADARPARQNEWSWERKIEDHAYTNSMGWDCVFMANLWNRKG